VNLTTHFHLVPRSIMRGAILPLPQYVFMVWCLLKPRDNCTFTFTLLLPWCHTANRFMHHKFAEHLYSGEHRLRLHYKTGYGLLGTWPHRKGGELDAKILCTRYRYYLLSIVVHSVNLGIAESSKLK